MLFRSREAVAGPDDARSAYAPARPRQAACQELGRDASAVFFFFFLIK